MKSSIYSLFTHCNFSLPLTCSTGPALLIGLLALLSLVVTSPLHAQYVNRDRGCTYLKFNHLKEGIGTDYITVNQIFEDREGFIWLSTETGLCRFDGNKMVYFPSDHTMGTELFHINAFCQDRLERIWMGTETGLYYFQPQAETIVKIPFNNRTSDHSEGVTTIAATRNHLWAATTENLYTATVDAPNQWKLFPAPDGTAQFKVCALLSSPQGDLWIGDTKGRVWKVRAKNLSTQDWKAELYFDEGTNAKDIVALAVLPDNHLLIATTKRLIAVADNGQQTVLLQHQPIQTISTTSRGGIWCATFGNGLFYFPPHKTTPLHYVAEQTENTTFNFINTSYVDSQDNLWIVPEKLGVRWLNAQSRHIDNYIHLSGYNSLSHNVVKGITSDKEGHWYMGTYNGLSIYSPQNNRFENHSLAAFSALSNQVEDLVFDQQGTLWIGTRDGLFAYLPTSRKIQRIPMLKGNFIWKICPSRKTQGLWLATRNGICHYSPLEGKIMHFNQQKGVPEELRNGNPISIYEDTKGNLWIGTEKGGLFVARHAGKTNEMQFQRYYNESRKDGFRSNNANTFYEDADGRLWIGTKVGLFCFQPENGDFKHYTQQDGLANPNVKGIAADPQKRLWLITHQGLSLLDPISGHMSNFNTQDGISGNIFNLSACLITPDGKLLAGGLNGLVTLNIAAMTQDAPTGTKPYLAALSINNKPILTGTVLNGRKLTDAATPYLKAITLNHNENNLAVELGAVELNHPERIRWAYRIPELNSEWQVLPQGEHTLSYANLAKGQYTLQFKWVPSYDAEKGPIGSLAITINPHWSQTTWAYGLYFLTALGLLAVLVRYREKKVREREELALEREMHRQTMELEQDKLNFFTNISHELRTPITLISAPLEELQKRRKDMTDEEQDYYLQMMHKNTNLLNKLMEQLLQFRKIQNGKATLQLQRHAIPQLLEEIVDGFSNYAEKQNLTLILDIADEAAQCLQQTICDADVIEKIVCNLLTNALKYTPEYGMITVGISLDSNHPNDYCITVQDNGIGIEPALQKQIFEQYERLSNTKKIAGTGIGLAYVKALVDLHQGKILLESDADKGSCFKIYLPANLNLEEKVLTEDIQHTKEKKGCYQPQRSDKTTEIMSNEILPLERSHTAENENIELLHAEKDVLLIVEDNEDLRNYLKLHFKDQFTVVTAGNGKEALIKIEEQLPDLILTDVMMPEMDGTELTTTIKSKWETSYIPVIMLTAMADTAAEMCGLSAGADYYLRKPFQPQQLDLIVSNMRKRQHNLQEHYLNQWNTLKAEKGNKLTHGIHENTIKDHTDNKTPRKETSPNYPTATENLKTQRNHPFINKINEYINAHISDPELTVEHLAEAVGVSSMQLYRKIKATADTTPNDYIRQIRMNRALELLAEGELNIAEIAYAIGYSDPKYFSKCFKTMFGKTPTQFKSESDQ